MLRSQYPPEGPEPGRERKADTHRAPKARRPAPGESFACARLRTSSGAAKRAPPPGRDQATLRRGGTRDSGPGTRRQRASVSVAERDSYRPLPPSPVLRPLGLSSRPEEEPSPSVRPKNPPRRARSPRYQLRFRERQDSRAFRG